MRGLRAEVRRLLVERRQAELGASRRAAATGAGADGGAHAPVAVNDIGGVSAADGAAAAAALPAPSSAAAGAVSRRAQPAGHAVRPRRRLARRLRLLGPRLLGATRRRGIRACRTSRGALWTSGTRISSQGELAPGDLVFFNGLGHVGMYIGGGQFVEAPHSGDVVKVSQLASRSDYLGAVRISG